MKYKHKHYEGFTLIEILVVVAVIGLLAAVITVALKSARASARDTKRKDDIGQVRKAIDLYYQEYGIYPSTSVGTGPTALSDSLFVQGLSQFIQRVPKDPACLSGTACDYQYILNSGQTAYAIYIPFERIAPCKIMSLTGTAAWFSNAPVCSY